jgi:sugar lactone lactonase YvrE
MESESRGICPSLTSSPPGNAPDGLALDVHSNAWVALNDSSSIARVTPGGSTEVVASGSPPDWCSSLSFGTSHGFRQTLFGVNSSIGELFGETGGFGPAVFSLDAGVQGMPLP